MKRFPPLRTQGGMFLVEALIAILIFSLGILGMIAMGSTAIGAVTDARFRTEASATAEAVASEIALRVNRSGATPAAVTANIAASLANFAHQPDTNADCDYQGTPAPDAQVRALVRRASLQTSPATGLPGSNDAWQQIDVDTTEFNRVTITVCWQSPGDSAPRKHVLVSYVN